MTVRVGLFVTCLANLMRPAVGFAAMRLLQVAGCQVVVPPTQTCCGQPAYNAGDFQASRRIARKCAQDFAGCDYVVVPSGSCAGMIRVHYPRLFDGATAEGRQVRELAARTLELTSFLVEIAGLSEPPGRYQGKITYHDSCSGLRELGVKAAPRTLLERMPGLVLEEMAGCETCCGFGGTFAVKFGEISSHLADYKCAAIHATGAQAVVGGDLGCLLHIEGRLRRLGDEGTRVLHVAEVLAGVQGEVAWK